MKIIDKLYDFFYAKLENNWDDKLFREIILRHINKDSVVLDIGAGAGIVSEMNFKQNVKFICGIDLDPRVQENPMLHEGKIADASRIPYEDEKFDLIFADNVMEHLEDPEGVFAEAKRVLKPGGLLLFKTPNRWHYMPIIARATPLSFHKFVNQLRGRAGVDTFKTFYRANSKHQVNAVVQKIGLHVSKINLIEGRPEYLRFNTLFYCIGILYEKLVNSHSILSYFRILMIVEIQKIK